MTGRLPIQASGLSEMLGRPGGRAGRRARESELR